MFVICKCCNIEEKLILIICNSMGKVLDVLSYKKLMLFLM